MSPILEAVIGRLLSGDRQVAQTALLEIAMFLECRRGEGPAKCPANQQLYAEVLSPELQQYYPSKAEQEELVESLQSAASNSPLRSSIIWAIGKALPRPGVRVLLQMMKEAVSSMDEESLYQWCIALRDVLEMAWIFDETVQIAALLRSASATTLLEEIIRSGDTRVLRVAGGDLALVKRLLEETR